MVQVSLLEQGVGLPQLFCNSMKCNQDKIMKIVFLFSSASTEACLHARSLLKFKIKPNMFKIHTLMLQTKQCKEKYLSQKKVMCQV